MSSVSIYQAGRTRPFLFIIGQSYVLFSKIANPCRNNGIRRLQSKVAPASTETLPHSETNFLLRLQKVSTTVWSILFTVWSTLFTLRLTLFTLWSKLSVGKKRTMVSHFWKNPSPRREKSVAATRERCCTRDEPSRRISAEKSAIVWTIRRKNVSLHQLTCRHCAVNHKDERAWNKDYSTTSADG